jgi:superfamily II DNA/RNA helicase
MLFDRERAFFPLSLLHSDVLYALMAARPVSVHACAFLPCGQTQACLLDGRMAGQMASSHLALAYHMSFDTLGLNATLLRAVTDSGYTTPTEVQARTIPLALTGADLRVCSNTGSGKTAAFVLPALQKVLELREAARLAQAALADVSGKAVPVMAEESSLAQSESDQRRKPPRFGRDRERDAAPRGIQTGPRVLVLAPTRELAMQVAKAVDTYGRHVPGLRVATAVGGMPYPIQIKALRGSLDILIATPGRLIDHLGSGTARLGDVEMLILDEADRMLDMGFIDDIQHIASQIPAERQTVMVSATFAGNVGRLAQQLQKPDAQRIDVSSHTDTHDNITQQLLWADDIAHKDALLQQILTSTDLQQAVVFTSTQRDADSVAERLYGLGHAVAPLHGGMAQGMRNRTLQALRRGELRVLVATDVAARGIDVPTISHVINYGLPMKAEDYVHRIGRTGRAGRAGNAVTLAERHDAPMLRRIQHFTTQQIPVNTLEGLEPKRIVPRLDARPEGRTGGFGGGGGRPGYGGNSRPGFGPRPGAGRGDFRGAPSAPRGDFQGRPDSRWEGRSNDGGSHYGHQGHDARSHGGPANAGPGDSGPRDGAPRRDAGAPGRRSPRY